MSRESANTNWDAYTARELAAVMILLQKHGYRIDEDQPHIGGERFLMQAVTTHSGKKLILLGTRENGQRVVIKATRDPLGIKELEHERACRNTLPHIDFAGDVFHTPQELLWEREDNFVVTAQEYIDQTQSFLERPLVEQFDFVLRAFRAQESAHATTAKHYRLIQTVFGVRTAATYLDFFDTFCTYVKSQLHDRPQLHVLLQEARDELHTHARRIEQYTGFLTHTDFVPHNFRIKDNTMYLLDHSSLTFGNKHEGWARFTNFAALHNPPLQKGIEQYVRDNRSPEEQKSLHLMRIYRLGEIIRYYASTLEKSSGDLHTLNSTRVDFWTQMLRCVLQNSEVPEEVITEYTRTRDSLRSVDEKKRQVGLL